MATDLSFFRSESAQRLREQGRVQGIEQGLERGLEQGLEQGIADTIVRILRRRGIEVSEESEQAITGCHDRARLDRWVDRSLDVTTAEELLAS